MGLFSKLFEAGRKEENANDVAALISSAEREVDNARKVLSEIEARRNALLIAGDEVGLDADSAKRIKAERVVERVALAMPDLKERHREAVGRARQVAIAEALRERDVVIANLRAALEAANDAHDAVIAFSVKTIALFGDVPELSQEVRLLFPLRQVTEAWSTYVRQFEGHRLGERPQSRSIAPEEIRAGTMEVKSHAGSTDPAKPVSAPAVAVSIRPDTLRPEAETPREGELRIQFYRGGVELPDGSLSRPGDMIDLPFDAAMEVVKAGAGDIVPCEIPNSEEDKPKVEGKSGARRRPSKG